MEENESIYSYLLPPNTGETKMLLKIYCQEHLSHNFYFELFTFNVSMVSTYTTKATVI